MKGKNTPPDSVSYADFDYLLDAIDEFAYDPRVWWVLWWGVNIIYEVLCTVGCVVEILVKNVILMKKFLSILGTYKKKYDTSACKATRHEILIAPRSRAINPIDC
jgi:hypothetical protein